MKWLYLIIILMICSSAVNTLKQLGVILKHVSQFHSGSITDYVTRLTSPNCQYVSEIIIFLAVQNDQQLSELQRQVTSLSIPLIFDFKSDAEADVALRIPKDSRAEVYFIGNYNSEQNCQKIGEYLAFAQSYQAAGLIPLVGQSQQTSVITFDNSQKAPERIIGYAQFARLNHFQIVQNIRLISKHTLQLAHSNIRQIQLMSNHSSICHQIFLNFVNAHFYPQLRNRIYKFAHKLPSIDSKNIPEKTQCVRKFIDTLGYSPLFYQKKIFNGKTWKNPNFDKVVELKKVALNAQLLMQAQRRRLYVQYKQELYKVQEKQAQNIKFTPIESIILQTLAIILLVLLISISILRVKIKNLATNVDML